MNTYKCQMQSTDSMQGGSPQLIHIPLRRRFRLTLAHRLDPRLKQLIKRYLKLFTRWQVIRNYPVEPSPEVDKKTTVQSLNAGDIVRIRALNVILATLDSHRRLKGCSFMPEMEPYCGTVHRVVKPVERYLNESDYTIRKSKGLVLLEDLFCQGVAEAGRWNIGVQVKITNPANITKRTINIISPIISGSKPSGEIHISPAHVVND